MLFRILAENVLHESLKIKLKSLTPGPNMRQLCRAGINKIKDMIRKVGWVPQKGILYVIPTPEHAEQCVNSFLDYDFSKVVSKVPECICLLLSTSITCPSVVPIMSRVKYGVKSMVLYVLVQVLLP